MIHADFRKFRYQNKIWMAIDDWCFGFRQVSMFAVESPESRKAHGKPCVLLNTGLVKAMKRKGAYKQASFIYHMCSHPSHRIGKYVKRVEKAPVKHVEGFGIFDCQHKQAK